MVAQLAYYAHMQPSEVGQLAPAEASELLRRVHKLRQEDEKLRGAHTHAIVEGLTVVVKQLGQVGQMIARALSVRG